MPKGKWGTRFKTKCCVCEKLFASSPYKLHDRNSHTCSWECSKISRRKPKTPIPCHHCGKVVFRKNPQRTPDKRVFCSRACVGKWRTATPVNVLRPKSLAGPAARLARFGPPVCMICGYDRVIEYAHIIPHAKGGTLHPDNVLILCPNHHRLFDRDKLTDAEFESIAERVVRGWGSSNSGILPGDETLFSTQGQRKIATTPLEYLLALTAADWKEFLQEP